MLEKIGLPAKPSMRGNNWVVDASHCQGCSSPFSFINRKHHCRRCGGIFCSSCTNQRMVLRGQGDSPVRICEPCKKLEEAARFELRHGHKNRTSRGGSKRTANHEDEVLNQILGTDTKQSSTSSNVLSDFGKGTSNASSSRFNEEAASPSVDTQNDTAEDIEFCSPEELRQLSLEEKNKYKILKGEGKPDEALRAFKRGKELERQAKALEAAQRKNNRKALSSNSLASQMNGDSEEVITKSKRSFHVDKEEKNDLASELRELGWSDADLHDANKKPIKTSLEGELSTLLGEVHKKSGIGKGTGSIDKTQVIAIKKKALMYKREGKLAEAKEELKKAKVLEKQLEEQEFFVDAEDSDDELSSLIRSMDDDKQDDFSLLDKQDAGFDFNHLLGVSDDLGLDGNFDVTEDDLEDPEMAAALESLGWTEDSEHPVDPVSQPVPVDGNTLLDEILSLKKEAVKQKRSGNVEEAKSLLRRARLLERDAETNPMSEKELTSQTAGSSTSTKVEDGMVGTSAYIEPKLQPKTKLMIQRELLALKKRALALRREGRVDEAEEELRKGKVLECQLEDMESAKVNASSKISEPVHIQPAISGVVGLGEEDDEADVTEQDMQDPAMLKMLENLGWKDENMHPEDVIDSVLPSTTGIAVKAPKRSKVEIQRELLGLKRKALTLRRQGAIEEAEEVSKKAKLLEDEMEEIEVSKKVVLSTSGTNHQEGATIKPSPKSSLEDAPRQDMQDPAMLRMLENLGWKDEDMRPEDVIVPVLPSTPGIAVKAPKRSKAEIQRELIGLKRKALTLRRQGAIEEAEEVSKKAKLLEDEMEEIEVSKKEVLPTSGTNHQEGPTIKPSPKSSLEDVPCQDMLDATLFSHLDNLGCKAEAGASVYKPTKSSKNSTQFPEHVADPSKIHAPGVPSIASISTRTTSHCIEDLTPLLDFDSPAEIKVVEHGVSFPQSDQSLNLVDLLTGNNWQSSQIPVEEVESKGSFSTNISLEGSYAQPGISKSSNGEKSVDEVQKAPDCSPPFDLRQEILARKRKAVALKREGKLAEAREELRQAKIMEKSLQEDKPQPEALVSIPNDTPLVQEPAPAPKPMSDRERFKLQQESLAHKRQALKLRREGRMAEAEAESELAKALETRLEESSSHDSTKKPEGKDDLGVEDLLDPQLLSALKAIGLEDAEIVPQVPDRGEGSKPNLSQEKTQLEQRIKAEKVKAVNLKQAGKQAEALEAFRRAKLLEKKLNTLA